MHIDRTLEPCPPRRSPVLRLLTAVAVAALLAAGCGGDDDDAAEASDTQSTVVDDASTGSTVASTDPVDEVPDEGNGGAADSAEPPTTEDASSGGDAAGSFGPPLEASASFALSDDLTARQLAVSPNGDRVAAMWVDIDTGTNLVVYDAATGDELIATTTTDDRLDGTLYWTADDRLVAVGNFGTVWAWDPATLIALGDAPLVKPESLDCSGGNGEVFDPVAGAVVLFSQTPCRIDLTTGEIVMYETEDQQSLLAVAVGGNEIYLRVSEDDGQLTLRTLDATTLELISDEPADGPNPVVAASVNGTVAQEGGGVVIEPAGVPVGFYSTNVEPSATGGYYLGAYDGGLVIVDSADGSTIGTLDSPSGDKRASTAWSADDSVVVSVSDGTVSVYPVG